MQKHRSSVHKLIKTIGSTQKVEKIISETSDDWLDNFEPLLAQPPQGDRFWAYQEFAGVQLGDQRLNQRLQQIATAFAQQPLAAIPQACGCWSQSKAAYRFFDNKRVDFAAILAAHAQATLQRIFQAQPSILLCPQDTTTLNYQPHPATAGLGPVGTLPGQSLGLLLHSTLAVTPQGEFLGVLHAKSWTRPNRRKSRRARSRRRKPLAEKESVRWLESLQHLQQLASHLPQVRLISVADREGDIYEMFVEAATAEPAVGLLIRASHNRRVVDSRGRRLFKWLRAQPRAGTDTIQVPRRRKQPARSATLAIHFGPVEFKAPSGKAKQPRVHCWGIWAEEMNPPKGVEPIRWFLLSTTPVRSLADAIAQIQWYTKRWVIEEFHRVLKSGCQVEARQLTTGARLARTLAVDMVVAWRVLNLIKAARVEPTASAQRWLTREEWQALYCYRHEVRAAPAEPPTIQEAVAWLAALGGWLGRKSDGPPGPKTLWRGLHRLKDIVKSWQLFGPQSAKRPKPKRRAAPRNEKRCG